MSLDPAQSDISRVRLVPLVTSRRPNSRPSLQVFGRAADDADGADAKAILRFGQLG
jgi:hypothetical protein